MKREETEYRERISRFVDRDEMEGFARRSLARTGFAFAHIWIGLGLSFWVVQQLYTRSPIGLAIAAPLLAVYVGTRMNALAVQVHEAAHGLLANGKRVNNAFCNFFGAYWVLNDVDSYWQVHREHHIHLLEEEDPDLQLYFLPSDRAEALLKILLKDLLWITAFQRIATYLRQGASSSKPRSRWAAAHTIGKIGAQAAVMAAFGWTFGPIHGAALYAAFWFIPLFSVFPVVIRIRITTEHFSQLLYEDHPYLFVSRTSISNYLETYLIGANMEYHMEHHLYPNLPHYQLKRLNRALRERGFFDEMGEKRENVLSGGYLHFWRLLLTSRIAPREMHPA